MLKEAMSRTGLRRIDRPIRRPTSTGRRWFWFSWKFDVSWFSWYVEDRSSIARLHVSSICLDVLDVFDRFCMFMIFMFSSGYAEDRSSTSTPLAISNDKKDIFYAKSKKWKKWKHVIFACAMKITRTGPLVMMRTVARNWITSVRFIVIIITPKKDNTSEDSRL